MIRQAERLHTDREYESELAVLLENVLLMGARVEGQLSQALSAYATHDARVAHECIESDRAVDELEVEIDGLCIQLLARRQPVASDLRFVTTTLKVVTDLERIGDLSTNVCERVVEATGRGIRRSDPTVTEMGEMARGMVHEAMDAFVARNVPQASGVVERDALVDEKYSSLWPTLMRRSTGDPAVADHLMRTLAIGKCIERVADHATNLAEMVVFMVQGEDVRHLRHASGSRRALRLT